MVLYPFISQYRKTVYKLKLAIEMKKVFLLAFLLLGVMLVESKAQDAAEEITEEEMMKFAAMEESVAHFLQSKQDEMVEMIKTNEVLGGAGRYNEVKAAWGNEEKLAEINVTDEEKAAFQEIQDFIDSVTEDVKKYKVDLIMDAEVLGAGTYNKIAKAMSADPSVKAKIDNLIAELKEQRDNGGNEVD